MVILTLLASALVGFRASVRTVGIIEIAQALSKVVSQFHRRD
ncbi:MAG: hypothetical protein NZ561_04040 [Phycisphaerae bacterium]|nr:hypothetical protein [Phycisphaerae bacterium]